MTIQLASKLIRKETDIASRTIEDCNALTYILLMDASYQIYYKYLRLLPLKQKYKQLRNDIGTKWDEWSKYFNQGLSTDEIADIGDAMDAFHDYIAKTEKSLCYSVLNEAGKLPEKYRTLICYTQIALLLARSADGHFSYIYKTEGEPVCFERRQATKIVSKDGTKNGATDVKYYVSTIKPKPTPEAMTNYIGALERFMKYIAENAERERCVCLFNSNPNIQCDVNAFINKTTAMPYEVIIEGADQLTA